MVSLLLDFKMGFAKQFRKASELSNGGETDCEGYIVWPNRNVNTLSHKNFDISFEFGDKLT
jgi:hypothetical protein